MDKAGNTYWGEESCTLGCGRKTSEKERPLGRPRLRWEDNIKTELQEERYRLMDWIDLVQDREACKRSNEPSGSTKWREFLDIRTG